MVRIRVWSALCVFVRYRAEFDGMRLVRLFFSLMGGGFSRLQILLICLYRLLTIDEYVEKVYLNATIHAE